MVEQVSPGSAKQKGDEGPTAAAGLTHISGNVDRDDCLDVRLSQGSSCLSSAHARRYVNTVGSRAKCYLLRGSLNIVAAMSQTGVCELGLAYGREYIKEE